MDEGDRRGVDRLTIQEAARRLGVSEGAVRKRVTRGTLQHDKAEDGRVYVYLDTGVDSGVDGGVDPNSNALISQLRDEVAYLRDENRRKDEIIMQQAMTMRQLSAAQPQGPTEPAETVEEETERAEPRPVTEGAQEGTESTQQWTGWLAPVDKLPWWHYVLGLFLVFSGGFLTYIVAWLLAVPLLVELLLIVALSGAPPGIFGFWVGYRKWYLRLWAQELPLGALVGTVALLGFLVGAVADIGFIFYPGLLLNYVVVVFFPAWLLFVSGSLIGNAWQRRRTGRISGITPVSPVSRATQGASQQPRKDLTPTQQAVLGWGGAIISALITLIGTIVTVRSGG